MSTEQGSMEQNVSQGRGVVDKDPFRVVGNGKADLESGGHDLDDKRGRGRPNIDKTWTEVGRGADMEQGRKK